MLVPGPEPTTDTRVGAAKAEELISSGSEMSVATAMNEIRLARIFGLPDNETGGDVRSGASARPV